MRDKPKHVLDKKCITNQDKETLYRGEDGQAQRGLPGHFK